MAPCAGELPRRQGWGGLCGRCSLLHVPGSVAGVLVLLLPLCCLLVVTHTAGVRGSICFKPPSAGALCANVAALPAPTWHHGALRPWVEPRSPTEALCHPWPLPCHPNHGGWQLLFVCARLRGIPSWLSCWRGFGSFSKPWGAGSLAPQTAGLQHFRFPACLAWQLEDP